MNKYTLSLLLLLFTASAHAANTYDTNTGILNLDSLAIAEQGAAFGLANYTGAAVRINKVSLISEKETPSFVGQIAWFDAGTRKIYLPQIAYGGQAHYGVLAVLEDYNFITRGQYSGPVVGQPCLATNLGDPSKTNRITQGINYLQVKNILGCYPSWTITETMSINGNVTKSIKRTFRSNDLSYAIQVLFNPDAGNPNNDVVILKSLIRQ